MERNLIFNYLFILFYYLFIQFRTARNSQNAIVETFSRLDSSWLGYEIGELLHLYSHALIQDGGRRCMFLMKNLF